MADAIAGITWNLFTAAEHPYLFGGAMVSLCVFDGWKIATDNRVMVMAPSSDPDNRHPRFPYLRALALWECAKGRAFIEWQPHWTSEVHHSNQPVLNLLGLWVRRGDCERVLTLPGPLLVTRGLYNEVVMVRFGPRAAGFAAMATVPPEIRVAETYLEE